ncbi:MAG: hypothetical protein LBB59_03505 [Campylobacteraceae bacterium]|jgi:hypothetical protein|nr:hypothetical protein [Campylobacteraceae bacterium]
MHKVVQRQFGNVLNPLEDYFTAVKSIVGIEKDMPFERIFDVISAAWSVKTTLSACEACSRNSGVISLEVEYLTFTHSFNAGYK